MTLHRRRRAVAALGVTALMVLSACGGDDDDADDTTTTEEAAATTEEDADDDVDEGGDDTTTTEADDDGGDDDPGSSSDLESVLLTADDLPDGWVENEDGDDSDDDAMSDDEGFCEGAPAAGLTEPPEDAGRDFGLADEGEFSFSTVSSSAGRYDGDGAQAFLDAIRDEMDRCDGQLAAEDSFLTDSTTLTDLDGIGDDALAIETIEDGGIFGLYVGRVDDVAVFLWVLAEEGQVDGEELLRTMASRA